jgi:hypothetical protein
VAAVDGIAIPEYEPALIGFESLRNDPDAWILASDPARLAPSIQHDQLNVDGI